MTNTLALKLEIIRSGYKEGELAKKIGMSPTTFSYKINNIRDFRTQEIKKIQLVLGLSDEQRDLIFFAYDVELNSTN